VAVAPSVVASDQLAFDAGFVAYNAKNYAGAAAAFDAMLTNYPNSSLRGTAYFYLGKCLYHLNDYAAAITNFDVVLNTYPTNAFADNALLWKGKSVQKQGYAQFVAGNLAAAALLFGDARVLYSQVVSNYPATTLVPDSQYQIALTYYDEKRYAEALAALQNVIANYPLSSIADGAQYYLARSMHALALVPTTGYTMQLARVEYTKLMTSFPLSVYIDNAQYQIGKTYYDELNYSAAIAEFDKLLLNYPLSAYADGAQYYKARSVHTLALALTPVYTLTQARAEYAKLMNSYPSSIYADNAQYQIGKTYYDELIPNYAAAIVEFDKVLVNYPKSSYADGAQYYKARSMHSLALISPPGYTLQQARDEYALVNAKYPSSIFVDNAVYHSAHTYHDSSQCTLELAAMQAFVVAYPGSFYVTAANGHIADLQLASPLTHTVCLQ